jgi:molecular chaperone DnaJ
VLLKDYFKILELTPGATLPEIKKAYRRLAMLHHPDKHKGDAYATARFHEIKEAYETLVHPRKKEHYLQQRWYQQSLGKKFSSSKPHTPATVLMDCVRLNQYVSSLNAFRIDKKGLKRYIDELLNSETIAMLKQFNETEVNKQIVSMILQAMVPLDYDDEMSVAMVLKKIPGADENRIQQQLQKKKTASTLEKYKIVFILLITAIICLLMWLSVR